MEASLPPPADKSSDEPKAEDKNLKENEEEKAVEKNAINLSGELEDETKTPAKDEVDSIHNPQSYRDNESVNASI